MKKLLYSLLLAPTMIACGLGENAKIDYTLDVAMPEGSDSTMVYLINYDSSDTIDSAQVLNKQVVFTGSADEPYMGRLLAAGSRMAFIVEGGKTSINYETGKVTGSALNDSLEMYETEAGAILEAVKADTTLSEELQEKKYLADMKALHARHQACNEDNPFGWYMFYSELLNAELPYAELLKVVAAAPAKYAESARVKRLLKSAEQLELTKEGMKMVDFAVKKETGSEVRLSDYVGKGEIVVVDFWASWCGPCRREAKGTLMDIHNKYNGKGLKVLGVAVWDNVEDTKAAIKKLGLPWEQIVNAQYTASELYGFNSIPHIIVFSGDGTILSRGLTGDELMAKVDELMANN